MLLKQADVLRTYHLIINDITLIDNGTVNAADSNIECVGNAFNLRAFLEGHGDSPTVAR